MAKPKKRRFSRPRFLKRSHKKAKHRLPILPVVGLGVAMIKPVENALAGDWKGAIAETGARFTGYNYQSGQVDIGYAVMNGWLPVIAGIAGHVVANKTGVNRMVHNVPFAGKYIEL